MTGGKTTSELMEILRDKHNIDISGGEHREALLKMGDFHGFKGYVILLTYIMKWVGVDEYNLQAFITGYIELTERLQADIPKEIYEMIFEADDEKKMNQLKVFIA